ncbi:hypothetical protein ACP4OV_003701 [Aristida adscensionis]
MDPQRHAVTKLGFLVLACNSALAIYISWGDAGTAAFVLAADAALLLLFLCIRVFDERDRGGARLGAQRRSALLQVLLAALTCGAAVDAHGARNHPGPSSAASVLVAYAALLAMTGRFLRTFARADGGVEG